MNSENFMKVADAIERDLDGFDMAVWCGTTCCVAGHAFTLSLSENSNSGIDTRPSASRVKDLAQSYLDLTGEQAFELFVPHSGTGIHVINANKDLVPDALRWMAHNDTTLWRPALEAARTAAQCRRQDSPSSPPMSPGTSEPDVVTA